VSAVVSIPHRFNGPLDSGQGGYSAGVVAGFVDGPAEVSLRRPVPLERELEVTRDGDGSVRMLDGEALVADGCRVPALEIDVPDSVTPEAAREATTRYPGDADGLFSRCFVCGRARDDGFHVFAGEVPGRRVMASPWTPFDWTADERGNVRPEFVWAALDCPATFSLTLHDDAPLAFLARFTVRAHAPVPAGDEHVVIGWPLDVDGRKYHAGGAIFAADGTLLATARALLIAPR